MSGGEFAAIEARWCADGGIGNAGRTTEETDAICAEYAFRDIPRLLTAVRERDNTIARVRELHPRRADCGSSDCKDCPAICTQCYDTYPCATLAALDPQETP